MTALQICPFIFPSTSLQHDQAHTAHVLFARHVLRINATRNRRSTVVVHVVMQLAISSTEALVLKEEWVIEKSKGIEDVEVGLITMHQSPQIVSPGLVGHLLSLPRSAHLSSAS